MSKQLSKALHLVCETENVEVVHLRDKFDGATPDTEWIGALGSEGSWIIISGDTQIQKKPHERKAWKDSGLTLFVFTKGWTEANFWEQAWRLFRWWPDIMKHAERHPTNAGFSVGWKQAPGKFPKII
ncbi:MAG: hypothetical protein IID55_12090 [Proteobacteria bacterium]|nr:hypothetical protein [Pseudomonadota bacterium]